MSRELVDSGIEWLGKIPVDWNMIKAKYILSITTGKKDAIAENSEGHYEFFTCSMENKKTDNYCFDQEALLVCGNGIVGFTRYFKGKFDAYQRTYVLGNFSKNVSPIYLKHYFNGLLRKKLEIDKVGSVIDFIKLGDLQNFNIVLPDFETQEKIASYLENKVSLIDETIENNKKAIELLEEYKWNRISELIKCGFDSELYMSNIQYLGKISKKFKITKLGRIFEIKKDIAGKEGFDVLSITQSGIKIKNIKSNEGQLAADYSKYQLVEVGDFAMNHMDLLTGWVDCSMYNGVTSPDYRVFRNKNKNMYHSDYFLYFLQLCYKQKIFYGMGQGVSNLGRWRLPKENFLNTMVPVPKYEDQRKIANYLDKMVIQLDKVIWYRKQIIEKLEEYKKSLIYEAVTGKIEV